MLNANEIGVKLQKLGVSDYQSRVLSALFTEKDITAKRIAEKAEVPITKIYGVLGTLINSGFIVTSLERPKRFSAIDPELVVRSLVRKHEDTIKILRREERSTLKVIKTITVQA